MPRGDLGSLAQATRTNESGHPEIPWRKVAGIGNVLRHDYDEVDAGVIWTAATIEVIPLRAAVAAMLAKAKGKP